MIRKLRFNLRATAVDETGDVPGWVLITLMTAAIVLVIWGIAGPLLGSMFQNAMDSVTNGP